MIETFKIVVVFTVNLAEARIGSSNEATLAINITNYLPDKIGSNLRRWSCGHSIRAANVELTCMVDFYGRFVSESRH